VLAPLSDYSEIGEMGSGNIFENVPDQLREEEFLSLFSSGSMKIERIVSTGQSSSPGFWFDQDWTEWIILLSGSAGLRIESEDAVRTLRPGDYLELPAHSRHRVEWTDPAQPTIWLAAHIYSHS
jgi:cupin 2 domain-containing protein